MRALDKKLLRDFRRIWPQMLAIALVMAAGVATLLLAVGAHRSLEETRAAYYERNRFADIFSNVSRAPISLEARIREIPGVAAVETRLVKNALLDIPGFHHPAAGVAISLPDHEDARINRLHMRTGRTPDPDRLDEVVVNDAFAGAHRFTLGSRFKAILNGHKRELTIVGIALSPEFIYAIGPGDLMPDDRRFAVMWMPRRTLASLYDLEGAFNSVLVTLLNGASEADVLQRLDGLTARYGGTGAYVRKDQISHAFLDAELNQLRALARVIPPIFLLVSAFLINMTLTRLIALEREQIGLFKALGYGRLTIAGHYVKLVLVVAGVGIAVGFALGWRFGLALTRLYADFFHFPFLLFEIDPDIYAIAAVITAVSAVGGGIKAVWSALQLAPAVAMQPPAPPRYQRLAIERWPMMRSLSQIAMMTFRHLVRWPVRAAMTTLGLALAASLLVVSLFSVDSIERMIDVSFFMAQRQDASMTFTTEKAARIELAVAKLPGVLRTEPYRSVEVRLRNGHRVRKLAISGKPETPVLSRVVNRALEPVSLPATGLMLDEHVARILNVVRGDMVEVEILEGRRGTVRVRVTDIIQSYFGLTAYMHIGALNQLMDEGPVVSGIHFSYDSALEPELFAALKTLPAVADIALQRVSLAKFRETLAKNINTMVAIYSGLAIVVAFGVVYNSARIQLSEQARDLASLRVIGFSRGEVSRVLLMELAILVIAAQPLGWLLGYVFGWITIQSFTSDLYRAPFIINRGTYALASLIVIAASLMAALVVRRRIDRLDLIGVLKTRD